MAVFTDITNTPVNYPGWTVQNGPAGSQNLVASSGASAGLGPSFQNGFLAQSFQLEDLALVSSGGVPVTLGTIQAAKMVVEDPITTSKAGYVVGTAAVTPTHGWLFLFDANGNVVASTADLLTAALTTVGLNKTSWASPVTLESGVYFAGAVQVGGTAGKLVGLTNPQAANNYNLGQVAGAGAYRFCTMATGVTASGYTGPATMTAINNDTTIQPFFGLL